MRPSRPAATRAAPPQLSDGFWTRPRMLRYLLFDATGVVYLLVGFVALRAAWALGDGPEAWRALLESFGHPAYLGFHVLALVSAGFVGVRFFALFPKAQPARVGPIAPPPRPVIRALLYAAWGAVTLGLLIVLGGIWP
jgi:fumarate reductase subunit C